MAKRKIVCSLTSKHKELTEASVPVVDALSRQGARVSAGEIKVKGVIRTAEKHVKMRQEPGCVVLIVLSKLGRQTLHAYNIDPDLAGKVISGLRGYTFNAG